MQRTRIDYATHSWNPCTGCLGPQADGVRCSYCYAHKLANGRLRKIYLGGHVLAGDPNDPFAPRWWESRINQRSEVLNTNPVRIFVCDMGDLFGDWMPDLNIRRVLARCHISPWHTFLFLTKNPKRLAQLNPWPPNAWVGTTVTNQEDADERIPLLLKADAKIRWLSIEPLMDGLDLEAFPGLRWIVVGALTGPNGRQPKPEWVQHIIEGARWHGIPVFIKRNLHWHETIQEYPDAT